MKKTIFLFLFLIKNVNTQSPFEQALISQQQEDFSSAINAYETVLQKEPAHGQALFNLGCCQLAIGNIDQAIAAFKAVLHFYPNTLPALYNCAYTHKTGGRLDKAIELYKQVLAIQHDYEPAHLALGFAYLMNGDFENGWQQHSRYLQKSGKNGDQLRALVHTNSIAGKTVLLLPEGGLGDSLQFVRYAQRLQSLGAYVIAAVQEPLVPLLSSCSFIDKLISHKDQMPAHDASATLMSLPAIFEDTLNSFPTNIPYIHARQQYVDKWEQKLGNDHNFKIGICWQADINNDKSRLPIARRGCPLTNFITLQNIPGVSFYSLQKYDGVEELNVMSASFQITHYHDLDEKTGPFLETAALMKNLDLIITVDTAVAHLAGALGCPVWLLLPYATDWRWINNRTDSPWYPTMKIFKQNSPFNWQEVMSRVYSELQKIK